MTIRRPHVLLIAAVLLGAGAATCVTALATYFARFSTFDGMEGEIDDDLYLQLTGMADTEKSALVIGGALVLLAITLAIVVVLRTALRDPRGASR